MSCLLVLVAISVPRMFLFFIFLLTDWLGYAYETIVWPVLGFLFMPYLTLAYMVTILQSGQIQGWWIALIVVAAFFDIASWSVRVTNNVVKER